VFPPKVHGMYAMPWGDHPRFGPNRPIRWSTRRYVHPSRRTESIHPIPRTRTRNECHEPDMRRAALPTRQARERPDGATPPSRRRSEASEERWGARPKASRALGHPCPSPSLDPSRPSGGKCFGAPAIRPRCCRIDPMGRLGAANRRHQRWRPPRGVPRRAAVTPHRRAITRRLRPRGCCAGAERRGHGAGTPAIR